MATLKEAIEYASKNPTSDFATQLATHIKSGAADSEAAQLGLDLTPIKSSSLGTAPAPAPKAPLPTRIADATINPIADRLGKGIVDTGKALYKRGEGIYNDTISRSKADANLPLPEHIASGMATVAHGALSAIAGGVGDIFSNMLSPFIPQKVKDTYSAETARAIQDIKTAWNEEPTNPDAKRGKEIVHNFVDHLTQKAKENPDIANALGDALNVALLGGGTAAENAAKPVIEKGIQTGVDAAGNIIKQGTEAAQSLVVKGKGVAANMAEKKAIQLADQNFKDALSISRPNAQLVEKAGIADKRILPGTQGYLRGADVAPSTMETRIAEAVQPLVENGEITSKMVAKDPAAVQQIIDRRVSQINQGLDGMAADHNVTFTKNFNPTTYLEKAKEGSQLVFAGDTTLERAYDSAVTRFQQLIKSKDLQGVIKARKAFDAEMRGKYPNLFKPDIFGNMSPRDSAIKNAIFDVRDSANKFISDALPTNNPYKALLKQESYLLRASENIGTKMKGITNDTNFFDTKTGKVVKYATGAVGAGTAGAVGIDLLK